MFYDRAMEAGDTTVGATRLASWTNSAGLGLEPLRREGLLCPAHLLLILPKRKLYSVLLIFKLLVN